MAFIKPQSPIKDLNTGNYFYPLTTADQVIMEDGSRLNSVFKHTVKTNATLLASNWPNEAPYTQTITLDNNIDTDLNVDVNIAYSGIKETDDVLNKAAGCLTYIKKNVNNIVFYCLKKKPENDIPIEIEGSCRNSIGSVNVIDGLKPNFEIVKYETEAELLADTPAENTIGIITDTEIVSWIFSATEPENPMEGMVWFITDRVSSASFNALKENGIQVYPVFARQYIGGEFVEKPAKLYNGDGFIEFGTYLFSFGNEYPEITGTWDGKFSAYNRVSVEKLDTCIAISTIGATEYALGTYNRIDLSQYTKLHCEYEAVFNNKSSNLKMCVFDSFPSVFGGSLSSKELPYNITGKTVAELDISFVNSGYVGFGIAGDAVGTFKFYRVWLS